MERMAKQLATRYGMDWREKGAYLTLAMPGHTERWLLINLDGERFSLTCCLVEPDETLTPEIDMVFTMHTEGWEPIELLYSHEAFTTYVQATRATNLPVYDGEGNLCFDTFTEYWAQVLEEQGWLAYGYPLLDPEADGRMPGCQSTNHTVCYGELWQCAVCGKTVCYNEGTDDHPELCDDCWAALVAPGNFTQQEALQLVCDCPEQCGTMLQLTHDGFLIVEDKDGLRVSFLLPDWLEFAIRRAMLVNATAADDAASAAVSRLEDDVPF